MIAVASDKELWASLNRETKDELARALGDSLLSTAVSKNWEWVLVDTDFVIKALRACRTECKMDPSTITKVVAVYTPQLISGNFEVVQKGDATFLRVGRVLLQVVGIEDNSIVFRGTLIGCSIGALVRARNVSEAASAIAENLVDAYLKFEESVSERKALGEQLKVDYIDAGLFKVPYVVDRHGKHPLEICVHSS